MRILEDRVTIPSAWHRLFKFIALSVSAIVVILSFG